MSVQSRNIELENRLSVPFQKVTQWVHSHPTTVKVLKISGLILGIGMLAATAFFAPCMGIAGIVTLAIAGSLLVLSSAIALLALDTFIPPHHDMKNHVYKPAECEGGKLFYQGDVPILSLESDDPFKAGRAQGLLCAEAIHLIARRFDFVVHTLGRRPRAAQLQKTLEHMRRVIPAEYLREIEGIAIGYNEWAEKQPFWKFPKKLTTDDILLFHLMPDSLHFNPHAYEKGSAAQTHNAIAAAACTSIVDRDEQNQIVLPRNMDWPSFGLAGTYSLVINRKHSNGLHNTVEVSLPGLAGTLTGMNSAGLALSMNVSPGNTDEIRGMPACFYNRRCLSRCRNVEEVENFAQNQSPLGPYHMTVADRNGGESIHFYQSPAATHVIRRWEENRPLVTLNYSYSPTPTIPVHYSDQRQKELNAFFLNRKGRPVEEALSLPFVDNSMTTHSVVMRPEDLTIKVGFDNAHAGKARLHTLSTRELLQTAATA